MRREFILVLLGIISISTFSSLLSGSVLIEDEGEAGGVLLDIVSGVVGAGNFSYWQLGYAGPLLIELTSLSGDADLYVSDSLRPSYEVDKNNFSSVTCGQDIVNIPTDFPRPIGIGVFGDWSYSISEYNIKVFIDTYSMLTKEQLMLFESIDADKFEQSSLKRDKPVPRKMAEEKPRFLKFLNILDMIFEMFVL